ncbi:MAG TPA: PQQ-binding-like beta-propeller repeat protein [Candidatus Lokiarchaeia archaeon]|nr:PQQ-binding-like beta-propeller repeat protein [Candidatus Lokiarchaeia archaeon]
MHSRLGLVNPSTMPGSSNPTGDEWPMFRGELNHTGTAITVPITGTGSSWTYSFGSEVQSSPAIADGRLFMGCNDNNTYCLNATSGNRIWYFKTGGFVESSPAIAGNCVFVGSNDNNVYCLNASTGTLVWSYPTGGPVQSSPAVANKCVYIGSNDHEIYCLNATTGAKIWNYNAGNAVRSSPAIVGTYLCVGCDDHEIYCLNATTGVKIWNYTTGNIVHASPAIADGCVYVGSWDGFEYCLYLANGNLDWAFATGDYVESSPAVATGRLYVGSGYDVYCLNAITGKLIWSYTAFNDVQLSPAIADDLVYVGSGDVLYTLNATTGSQILSNNLSIGIGFGPVIANGHVFVGNSTVWSLPMLFQFNFGQSQPFFMNLVYIAIGIAIVVGVIAVITIGRRVIIRKKQHQAAGNQEALDIMLVNTCMVAFLFTLSGGFILGPFHEGGHAIAEMILSPRGTNIIISILEGFSASSSSSDLVQGTIISIAGPAGSFIALNVIIFILQRRINVDNSLARMILWGCTFPSITTSTGYFLGTLIYQGDTYQVAANLSLLLGIPFIDIAIAFTIIGAILTFLYLYLIYRGLKPDLVRYYRKTIGNAGKTYIMLLALAFIGVAFLTLLLFTMMQYWGFYKLAATLIVSAAIPLSFNGSIVLIFGIIIFSIFGLMLLANRMFIARLDERFYIDNLKILVITLLIFMFFLIFPVITIITGL